MNPVETFRAALAFLTRLPVGSAPISARASALSPALFPLVGALLGLIHFAVMVLLRPLGDWVSAIAATALGVFVTGAFHEDGLADTADALGGQVSRERALEIMKDSRIGTYGSVALVLALSLRVALFTRIDVSELTAWVLYGTLARLGPLWLMVTLPHASPSQGKLKDLLQIEPGVAWVGTLLSLALAAACILMTPHALPRLGLGFLATTIVTLAFARLATRRLGGITGDVLGATEQVIEACVLMVFAWR